jgi:hypothetical protein
MVNFVYDGSKNTLNGKRFISETDVMVLGNEEETTERTCENCLFRYAIDKEPVEDCQLPGPHEYFGLGKGENLPMKTGDIQVGNYCPSFVSKKSLLD